MTLISSRRTAAARLHGHGDLDRARQLYRKVLDLDPRDADALYSMGVLAEESDALKDAVCLMSQSLDLEPTAEKCIFIGKVLEKQNRNAAALAYYRKAKQLDPCGPTTLEALAEALDRRQEYEESSGVWARRLRLECCDSARQLQLRLYLTNALRLAGHLSPAGQVLRQARAMSSGSS